MKYILAGNLGPDWIGRQKERMKSVRAKADELGITIEDVYYTQGVHDLIDVVEVSDPYVMLGFSLWYTKQGYGKISSMPAFDEATMEMADEIV